MSKPFLANLVEMCEAFFLGCKVKLLPGVGIESVDRIETREFPGDPCSPDAPGLIQYNASKILNWLFRVYKPKYPRAICLIAVTTEDIYPEEGYSFVFGVANVMTQSGVFSFCRYSPAFN